MSEYCQDRDLLGIEPIVFLGGGFPGQDLLVQPSGTLSGTTFTAGAGSFIDADVKAGMVLCLYATTPAEGDAYEIVSVDSATTLTASVLRADSGGPAVAPPPASAVPFYVRTYAAQIRAVSTALGEKLRQISEVAALAKADFADSSQLRLVTAYGTLTDVFVARSDNAEAHDANWVKAQHYRQLYRDRQLQLRLAVDSDGDGVAERTRSLGNVTLRRS